MPQSAYKKVALRADNVPFTGQNGNEQGVKKSSDSVRFYALPLVVAEIKGLSCGAKGLFAKLIFDAWNVALCRVGVGSLAKCLGTDNRSIRRWIRELELRDLIRVVHERACCCYYLNPKYRVGLSIPLLAETMKRRGIGQMCKLALCLLSYRQRDNDYCWPKQKVLAVDLGVSVRQIQRVLAGMKGRGEVQIRLRGRNRKQGNKYVLTCGAVLGGRVFGLNSHTTECTHLNKKRKAKSYFKPLRGKFLPGDLSAKDFGDGFGPEAVFLHLVGCGVHEKVARPMALEQLHPFESVVQAINNAKILRAAVWQRSLKAGFPQPKFNVPGYVVATLNGTRREGKVVGTTRLFRDAAAMSRALKISKARQGRRKPLSEAEFADRVLAAKRALGA